jgi:cytochrome c-type biogenesis protein CcmH/NrfG
MTDSNSNLPWQLTRQDMEGASGQGRTFQGLPEEQLVGLVGGHSSPNIREGAAAEMQRRLLVAFREFNEKSSKQADTMIRLTRIIVVLTIVLGIIAAVQVWLMVKGGA